MRTNVKCNTRFPWNNVILKIWRRMWHDVGYFKGWPLETRNLAASQCDSHYQRLIGLQVWKKIEACTCTKRAFDFHTDTRVHTGVLVTALFTILSLSLSLSFFLLFLSGASCLLLDFFSLSRINRCVWLH